MKFGWWLGTAYSLVSAITAGIATHNSYVLAAVYFGLMAIVTVVYNEKG